MDLGILIFLISELMCGLEKRGLVDEDLLRRASVARVNTRLQRYVGQLPNCTAALLIHLL